MTWSDCVFYLAFLSQIFVLSWWLPGRLLARMQHVFANYPPASYPRLYPRPVEHYRMAHAAFRYACRFVLLVGFLILIAVMFWVNHGSFADDGYISEAWPAAYGILQFLPLMLVEISEFGHLKLMRKANVVTKRVADLQRRKLTDLVAPGLLASALLAYAGAVAFDLYVHDFAVGWGHDTVQRAIVMFVTNALLAAVGAWHLYGRKLDPHQAATDRNRRIAVTLKSLLYISMALSAFNAVMAADDAYDLNHLEATLVSVYFQAIAVLSLGCALKRIRPDEIDFDVYRNDAPA